MTKKAKDNWRKEKELESHGFKLKPPAVRLHGRNETPKHLFVKAMLAHVLQNKGRRWDTEVKMADGRVDVLDLGPTDEPGFVYEVETGVTPKRHQEKVDQYAGPAIQDVLVIDPADVPDTPEEAVEYLEMWEVVG